MLSFSTVVDCHPYGFSIYGIRWNGSTTLDYWREMLDAVQQHARGVRVLEHGNDGTRLREHAVQLLDLPRVVNPRDEMLDDLLYRTLRTLMTGRTG